MRDNRLPPAAALQGVFTWKYDNTREGKNTAESILTPANVNSKTFGKLISVPVDGFTYAQPLYAANVSIPGQVIHNVVYAATENTTLYA